MTSKNLLAGKRRRSPQLNPKQRKTYFDQNMLLDNELPKTPLWFINLYQFVPPIVFQNNYPRRINFLTIIFFFMLLLNPSVAEEVKQTEDIVSEHDIGSTDFTLQPSLAKVTNSTSTEPTTHPTYICTTNGITEKKIAKPEVLVIENEKDCKTIETAWVATLQTLIIRFDSEYIEPELLQRWQNIPQDYRQIPVNIREKFEANIIVSLQRSSSTASGLSKIDKSVSQLETQQKATMATQHYRAGFQKIRQWLTKRKIALTDMLELHRVLTATDKDAGKLRDVDGGLPFARFVPAKLLQNNMEQLVDWLNTTSKEWHPIQVALFTHQYIIANHPFFDANSRFASLITNWVLMQHGLTPIAFSLAELYDMTLYTSLTSNGLKSFNELIKQHYTKPTDFNPYCLFQLGGKRHTWFNAREKKNYGLRQRALGKQWLEKITEKIEAQQHELTAMVFSSPAVTI